MGSAVKTPVNDVEDKTCNELTPPGAALGDTIIFPLEVTEEDG